MICEGFVYDGEENVVLWLELSHSYHPLYAQQKSHQLKDLSQLFQDSWLKVSDSSLLS